MLNVVIFGKGNEWEKNKEEIRKDFVVKGIIDNAFNKIHYDKKENLNIYPPLKINELKFDKVIITSSKYFVEMFYQLKTLAVSDDKILLLPNSVGNDLIVENNKLYYMTADDEKYFISTKVELDNIKKENYMKLCDKLEKSLLTQPISLDGSDYGMPIDRYYIEKFLEENRPYITGSILEVQDDRYTSKYGEKVKKSIISHVRGENGAMKVNFETGEGVLSELVDCIICTQTLQYIYDVRIAIKNMYKLLKPNGTILISVPGIKPISLYHNERWGEYWSFTVNSIEKLCKDVSSDYKIYEYGNVKSSTAFLYGINKENLSDDDLNRTDKRYPMIICAMIHKGK